MVEIEARRLSDALEKWSQTALTEGWVERWMEGAIFPREMVFFLALCDASDVRVIVESGRQDGYSAELIGFYARQMGGRAYSIDFEYDAERAARCRARLATNPALTLVKGNGVTWLGPLLRRHAPTPSAVLLDGPKGYLAMSLFFAATRIPGVSVCAVHNVDYQLQRAPFASTGPQPHFHEEVTHDGPFWKQLAEAEIRHGQAVDARRSLTESTLGVLRREEVRNLAHTLELGALGLLDKPRGIAWKWRTLGPMLAMRRTLGLAP
jgi:predicted O-methyltransferase YrrM